MKVDGCVLVVDGLDAFAGSPIVDVVENVGVPPDYEVPFDPAAWRQGRDPQLEKAVDLVLEQLKKEPPKFVEHQPFPNYHETKGKAAGGGH